MKGGGTEGVVRFRENGFVRAAPSAAGAVLGVMKRGDALPFTGEVTGKGWIAVEYRGSVGWVSGRLVNVRAATLDKVAWDE